MWLLWIGLLSSVALADDKLLFAQAVFRHGDRTPIFSYETDPYNETFWGRPFGDLTERGMKQHFIQGSRLRARYVDNAKLIRGTYNRDDIKIRSSQMPRCLQSSFSNAAGLYQGSATFPNDVDGWPSGWTPIPVHAINEDEDRAIECGGDCPRKAVLMVERALRKEYQDYIANYFDLFETIAAHTARNYTGGSLEDVIDVAGFYLSVHVERGYYNLTLPAWVTDDVYNRLEEFVNNSIDYVFGSAMAECNATGLISFIYLAGFGADDDINLINLRGGFLLQELIGNFQGAKEGGKEKLRIYQAHDVSIMGLLQTLECKKDLVGIVRPDYASAVLSELWKKDDGKFYVKFLYSDNASTDYKPFTKLIKGCPTDSDFCLLDTLISRSAKYTSVKPSDCNLL